MEIVLEGKDAGHWIYRGEGAANLVLAYTGSSPPFVGKVLRVHKVARNGSECENGLSPLTMHECLLWKDIEDFLSAPTREIVQQLYVQHVLSPLLGSDHVDAGIRVLVSKEFLESIESNVLRHRPSWRVIDAKVNIRHDSAILLSDLSRFPHSVLNDDFCISVEIKPKCGFLPISDLISEKNFVKKTTSRFRMHQALKYHQRKISEISEYDPLNLFSGSMDRIKKAMTDLFLTPQNNFRVFLNGSLIYGGSGGGADMTSSLTQDKFEDVLKRVILAGNGKRTRNFLQLVADTVFRSGLLDRLLEVQKLDKIDIEGAIHAYYNVVSQPCKVCREFGQEEVKLAKKYTYLHSDPLSKSLEIVKDYLVAATTKDLSMMISFRPTDLGSSHNVVLLESTNQNFEYKVSFIDLDIKPLKKMIYYYELDQKIVNWYSQTIKEKHHTDGAASIDETLYSEQCSAMEDASHVRDSAVIGA